MLNPLILFGVQLESIDTLFDADQRGKINLTPFFSKQYCPERVSNEANVSHERMSKKGVKFVNHPPAFE
jgi:hypothetical protein